MKRSCQFAVSILLGAWLALSITSPVRAGGLLFVNEGTLSGWGSFYTTNRPYSVQQIANPTRSGSSALRFEVRGGETDSGDRYHSQAERGSLGAQRGATRFYGFSVFVPDYARTYDSGFTIQQWLTQTPEEGYVPTFMFLMSPVTGRFSAYIISSPNPSATPRTTVTKDAGPVRFGGWTDFVVKYEFNDVGGRIVIWQTNGASPTVPVMEYDGATCYPDTSAVTKSYGFTTGMYAYSASQLSPGESRVVVIDSVRIGTATADWRADYEAVKPR